ncbi:MAG: hypothetical protein R3267_04215 [Paenisporosarcina sp.]|nr:hypothetical protein [Paenisporosarcina sp.]
MAFTVGKLKCYFCGEKDGVFESVCKYGIYGDVGGRIHYHMECLQLIEAAPEKYGNIMVDKAIFINESRQRCMQFNKELEPKFKKKINELFKHNFERMMPSNKV